MNTEIKEIFNLYETGMSMNKISQKFTEEKRLNHLNSNWREDKILKIIITNKKVSIITNCMLITYLLKMLMNTLSMN